MGILPAVFILLLAVKILGLVQISWLIVFSPLIATMVLLIILTGLTVWAKKHE